MMWKITIQSSGPGYLVLYCARRSFHNPTTADTRSGVFPVQGHRPAARSSAVKRGGVAVESGGVLLNGTAQGMD